MAFNAAREVAKSFHFDIYLIEAQSCKHAFKRVQDWKHLGWGSDAEKAETTKNVKNKNIVRRTDL